MPSRTTIITYFFYLSTLSFLKVEYLREIKLSDYEPTFSPTFSPTMELTENDNNDDDSVDTGVVLIVFFSAVGYLWFMVACLCCLNPYENVSDE